MNTLKLMTASLRSWSQCQWQLYFPSSLSVTLKIDRVSSFLHLALVSFSSTLYFFPLTGLSLNVQNHFCGQLLSEPIQQDRLSLEDWLARTSFGLMLGTVLGLPATKKN